jgi:hypothetical protein
MSSDPDEDSAMTKESGTPESGLNDRPPWADAVSAGTPPHPLRVTQPALGECVTTVQVAAHSPKYPNFAGD